MQAVAPFLKPGAAVLCLGTCGVPRRLGVSYQRSNPVLRRPCPSPRRRSTCNLPPSFSNPALRADIEVSCGMQAVVPFLKPGAAVLVAGDFNICSKGSKVSPCIQKKDHLYFYEIHLVQKEGHFNICSKGSKVFPRFQNLFLRNPSRPNTSVLSTRLGVANTPLS